VASCRVFAARVSPKWFNNRGEKKALEKERGEGGKREGKGKEKC